MGFLIGSEKVVQQVIHRLGLVDAPVLAPIFERCLVFPDLEHNIERFPGHLPVLAPKAVDVEQRPVAGQPRWTDAQQEAALGQMVR
jgi:hypothetical protein